MQVQVSWESQLLALAGKILRPSTRPLLSCWAGDADLKRAYAAAWADTMSRYHIPRHYALQLIDGVNRDIHQSVVESES